MVNRCIIDVLYYSVVGLFGKGFENKSDARYWKVAYYHNEWQLSGEEGCREGGRRGYLSQGFRV